MNSIVLLKLSALLSLTHQHHDRGGTVKERVTTPFVGFPCCDKVRQALLEEVLVDFDLCHCG